ncbi:MAG: metal-sensitive transcriptional regulator [Myxococcota bacterium]
MTDPQTKKKLIARLRRAEGQLAAVRRMVEDDAYCVDVMTQISAVQGALSRAGSILLGSHIEHCVADAFESGDTVARQEKIEELLDVFSKYGARG